MARVASTSLFKRIRVVSNFCVYCWKRQMNRRISLELNPWGPHPSLNWGWKKSSSCVYYVLQTTSRKNISRRGRARGKEMYQEAFYTCKICCLTFKTFCFLTQLFSLLSPSSLLNPLSFIDVCKLLGIRMRFFVWGLYERLRSDPNTLNKITPESWIGNIYESSNVTVAPTRTIQWYLRLLCAKVWFLYRYFPHYF